MSFNDNEVAGENFIFDEHKNDLFSNIGRLITVFTQSGGCTGCGFTGLLIEANCRFIKLITSLPSAPRHPFGIEEDHCCRRDRGGFCGRDRCSRFGTIIIIPVNKIVAFVFNEI